MEVKDKPASEETVIPPVEGAEKKEGEEVVTPPATVTPAPTAGEVVTTATEPKVDPKVVPEAAFLEQKKELKEAHKEIAELRKKMEGGASKGEISDDLKAIADEYKIDMTFLNKLAGVIRADVEKTAASTTEEALKPLTERERNEKINVAFTKEFERTMGTMPEYAEIVNADVIKTLSLQPQNAKKTFAQIIEDTYGSAITGKRTIDSTTPAGGKEPAPLDFARARRDSAYFDEVMANPKLKAEYNEKMLKEGF